MEMKLCGKRHGTGRQARSVPMNVRLVLSIPFLFLAAWPFPKFGRAADNGTEPSRLLEATRAVVRAVVREAAGQDSERSRSATEEVVDGHAGDALTRRYVKAAAKAASEQAEAVATKAFVFGLGIACDDSGAIRRLPVGREFCAAVESATDRKKRLAVIGQATLHGRHDLWLHFIVSSYLTGSLGAPAAEATGLMKEFADARGDSGFSFADLAADKAGVRFAASVLQEEVSLHQLAEKFTVIDHMPSIRGLPEGLSLQEIMAVSESESQSTYARLLDEINARLNALPVYCERNVRKKGGDE
jgi:hypothetical protein